MAEARTVAAPDDGNKLVIWIGLREVEEGWSTGRSSGVVGARYLAADGLVLANEGLGLLDGDTGGWRTGSRKEAPRPAARQQEAV